MLSIKLIMKRKLKMNEEINFEKYGSCVPIEKPRHSVDEIQQPAFLFLYGPWHIEVYSTDFC